MLQSHAVSQFRRSLRRQSNRLYIQVQSYGAALDDTHTRHHTRHSSVYITVSTRKRWYLYGAALICIILAAWLLIAVLSRSAPTAVPSNVSVSSYTVMMDHQTDRRAISASTSRRILLVSYDIAGPNRNGGIGTAQTNMARVLSRQHEVTLLHAGTELVSPDSQHTFVWWQSEFSKLYNITLVSLPQQLTYDYQATAGTDEMIRSYEVLLWLLQYSHQFDIVHFHDWRGLGFYTQIAARQGQPHLAHLIFVTICHSISLWSKLGSQQLSDQTTALIIDYMERSVIQSSQYVISPSRYMFEWMHAHQYEYGSSARIVQPNPIVVDQPVSETNKQYAAVKEIVYFARLETRKGLDVFMDAIDLLDERYDAIPYSVTLVGRIPPDLDSTLRIRIDHYVHLKGWQVFSNLSSSDAMSYLTEVDSGRLAVMPSRTDNSPYTVQEALAHSIPFIASNVGGTQELIAAGDRNRCTFNLTAAQLERKLYEVVSTVFMPAAPAVDFHHISQRWIDWHSTLQQPTVERLATTAENTPLVSVVIATYNRTNYVVEALQSLARQTYTNIEVIVIDDGTIDLKSVAYLTLTVEPYIHQHSNWRLIRAEHAYEAGARNRGARESTGAYIMFMDDDNIAKSHEVETFVRAMQYTSTDVLTCLIDRFYGDQLPTSTQQTVRWLLLGPSRTVNLYYNTLGDTNFFIRRQVFEELGGFDESADAIAEDFEFLAHVMLSSLYTMQVVPEALVWKRTTALTQQHIHESNQHELLLSDVYLAHLPHDVALSLLTARQAARVKVADQAGLLAHSSNDFSIKQNVKQWSYTYMYANTATPTDTVNVQLLDTARKYREPDDSTRLSVAAAYEHISQQLPQHCFVRATSQHPCIDTDGRPVSTYRKWRSNIEDTVVVSGVVTRAGMCGVGNTLTVELDNALIHKSVLQPGDHQVLPNLQLQIRLDQTIRIGVHAARYQSSYNVDCSQVDIVIQIRLL